MANNCCFNMMVVGSKDNVKELAAIMNYEHPEKKMCRIFSAYVYEEDTMPNGEYYAKISGDCAWSVYVCMFDGAHTYASQISDPEVTTLPAESARLNLDIEVYSDEPGVGFAEHYRIINGVVKVFEEAELEEYWYNAARDGDFSKYKKEMEFPEWLTEDMFEEDDIVRVGGYEEKFAREEVK